MLYARKRERCSWNPQVSDELPADAGSAACIPGWCGGCALGHYPHAVEAGIRQRVSGLPVQGRCFTVLALLLVAGYNNTAYYPSTHDLQSSLTLANSCSSQFTLKVMAYVSILVPFVLAYIFYAWRSIDNRKIDAKEMEEGGHAY